MPRPPTDIRDPSEALPALRSALGALSPTLDRTPHGARTTTALLTRCVVDTLTGLDWQCRREFPVDAPTRGYLDVLATHPDGVTLAIEIDRSHKPWSVEKMMAAGQRYGAAPVWVRWRERLSLRVPEGLCVFDMTRGTLRVLNAPEHAARCTSPPSDHGSASR